MWPLNQLTFSNEIKTKFYTSQDLQRTIEEE